MMVNKHLAAVGALNERGQRVLTRRGVEVATDDKVGLLHSLCAERCMTGVDGNLLEARKETERRRGLVGHNHTRILPHCAQEVPQSERAPYRVAVGLTWQVRTIRSDSSISPRNSFAFFLSLLICPFLPFVKPETLSRNYLICRAVSNFKPQKDTNHLANST